MTVDPRRADARSSTGSRGRVLAMTGALYAVALAAAVPALPGTGILPSPSAEQILERNAAARGGLEAWRRVAAMVWIGHIESARAPAPRVPFTLIQQRPNKTHFEITALGQRNVRVFDGTRGWKLRPGQTAGAANLQPYGPEELKFARGGQGLDGPLLDAGAKGNVVNVDGLDEIEGREAYRLEVRLPGGERDRLWVDAKTFLEIRCDRVVDGPPPTRLPRKVVSVLYRDYRTFDGLKMPSVIETSGDAHSPPDRMVIERVLLNPPLDARTFESPTASHSAVGGRVSP